MAHSMGLAGPGNLRSRDSRGIRIWRHGMGVGIIRRAIAVPRGTVRCRAPPGYRILFRARCHLISLPDPISYDDSLGCIVIAWFNGL